MQTLRALATNETQIKRLLWGIMGIWMVANVALAFMRHQRFNSTAYDLAIYSQVLWNTAQGHFFASTVEISHSYLGDHVQPILLLLAPFYYLGADARLLLLIQSVVLGATAVPVYLIARQRQLPPWLALLFALIYLLFPTLIFINRYDFHPIIFAIPFLLLAYLDMQTARYGRATVWAFLAMISNDEIGLTLAPLGLYLALVKKQRLLGGVWAITGLAWALATQLLIIPFFRPDTVNDTMQRYFWLGPDAASQIHTLLTQPGMVWQHISQDPLRQQYLLRLLLPVGYLALLSPLSLMMAAPAIAYNLLSDTPSQHSIYFQYSAPIIPFVLIGAIEATAWLYRRYQAAWLQWFVPVWLLAGLALAWALDNPFTKQLAEPYFPVYTVERFVDQQASATAVQLIPPEASVAGMMTYLPHVSERPILHLFYDRLRLEQWPFGFPQTDYALLHLSDMRYWVNPRLFYAQVETAIGQLGYEAVYFDQDVVVLSPLAEPQPETGAVLQRVIDLQEAGGKYAPTAPETLAWMGRQWVGDRLPATAVSFPVHFAENITLLGYTLSGPPLSPGRPLCVTLYWQAASVLPVPYTVFVHFVDETGYVHAQRDGQPTFGFYPMTAWAPGEIIGDMHCFPLPAGLAAGEYGLNIGLYDSLSGERLPVLDDTLQPAPGAARLTTIPVSP